MTDQWSKTDIDILEALTLKVRTFTIEQIAAGWHGAAENVEAAEKQMQPLVQVGLAERLQVYAHPMIPIAPPAFHWSPGDPKPSEKQIRKLAEHFQGRWTKPEQTFTTYVATKRAANLFGSYATEPPSTDQWTHDIHVGEIYVDMMRRNTPEELQRVIGEGALPKLGLEIKYMKDPDIFVVDENQQATAIIEFAGAYDEEHIKALHDHCAGGGHAKLKKRFPNRQYRLYPDPNGTPYMLV